MKLRPFEDRVIIKQTEASKEMDGVLLPEGAQKPPAEGVVVAVGPGVIRGDQLYLKEILKFVKFFVWSWAGIHGLSSPDDDTADYSPMQVRVGDYVLFGMYAGTKIKVDGEDYIMVRQADCFMCDEEKNV